MLTLGPWIECERERGSRSRPGWHSRSAGLSGLSSEYMRQSLVSPKLSESNLPVHWAAFYVHFLGSVFLALIADWLAVSSSLLSPPSRLLRNIILTIHTAEYLRSKP